MTYVARFAMSLKTLVGSITALKYPYPDDPPVPSLDPIVRWTTSAWRWRHCASNPSISTRRRSNSFGTWSWGWSQYKVINKAAWVALKEKSFSPAAINSLCLSSSKTARKSRRFLFFPIFFNPKKIFFLSLTLCSWPVLLHNAEKSCQNYLPKARHLHHTCARPLCDIPTKSQSCPVWQKEFFQAISQWLCEESFRAQQQEPWLTNKKN